jgi:signal transduction histidine kinase
MELVSPAEMRVVISGSVLPFYIAGTVVAPVLYFRWFLRPVAELADGARALDDALPRMRSFSWHFWVLFGGRHLIGSMVLYRAIFDHLGGVVEQVQVVGLAIMMSVLAGLPAYLYIVDLFARTIGGASLGEPLVRVRTRVFLISVLVPVILNTAILLYLSSALGELKGELIGLWIMLTGLAIVAASNLMGSLERSVAGLRRIAARRQRALEVDPEELQVRSVDELGVLTSEYRALLTDLKRQAALLDVHNRVLQASNLDVEPDVFYARLLDAMIDRLSCDQAELIAAPEEGGEVEVLASVGEGSLIGGANLSSSVLPAMSGEKLSVLPYMGTADDPSKGGAAVVIPLVEGGGEGERLALVLAAGDITRGDRGAFDVLLELGGDIAAAVRGVRMAEENEQLERMLLSAQRMDVVGRLAAGVAHDFNNILTVMVGAAAHLREEELERADVEENAGLILEAAQRATTLTRQLLTFSSQGTAKVIVLDVNEVVRGIDKLLRKLLPETVELQLELAADALKTKAEVGHIEQVITNLVVNARDAMAGGGRLALRTSLEDGQVVLRVEDDGAGIHPDVIPHIFEPFFTTKPQDKGTGLGLATVYGIVMRYDGTIDVDSEEGRGTLVTMRLPAVDLALDEAARARRALLLRPPQRARRRG